MAIPTANQRENRVLPSKAAPVPTPKPTPKVTPVPTQKTSIDKQVKSIGGSKESQELVRQILTEQAKMDSVWNAAGGTEGIIAGLSGLGTLSGAGTGAGTGAGAGAGTGAGAGADAGAQVTGPTLAQDTFRKTLSLLMGETEASKAYVSELYKLFSGFYKTGSTIEEAINLALYQAKELKVIPEFTNRFSGIFSLQERRAKGEAIDVPTIYEYVKSQEEIGNVLRKSNLNDLANETFLNTVMATGKSVAETTRIIADVFDAIDTAPKDWYNMVQTKMPFATRTDLARAILLGAEGAAELERKVNKYGIMAAGQSQGLAISEATASDLIAKKQTYATAKPKFGQAAAITATGQKLTSMETGVEPGKAYTQEQAFSAVFDQNYQELQNIQNLSEKELGRFSGKSGYFASKNRAAGQI
jgi:hypothetical protein